MKVKQKAKVRKPEEEKAESQVPVSERDSSPCLFKMVQAAGYSKHLKPWLMYGFPRKLVVAPGYTRRFEEWAHSRLLSSS